MWQPAGRAAVTEDTGVAGHETKSIKGDERTTMSERQSCTTPLGLLTLLGLPWVGPTSALRLAASFGSIDDVRDAPLAVLQRLIGARAAQSVAQRAHWQQAELHALELLERTARAGGRVIAHGDPEYPPQLRRIVDAPAVLYAKGSLSRSHRSVACVGTRQPSAFGERTARSITAHLAREGWSIVSGLAKGVDTACHWAALAEHGHTVAILGSGLESIHPRSNQHLADAILAEGGALLSELPPNAPPSPHGLVRRDRLQSGMSVGTIVMQTDIVGGAMHTVRYTLVQERLLAAPVPMGKHATEPKSQGILALTTKTGHELVSLLEAKGAYAQRLREHFGECPPAFGLRAMDDLPRLVALLDAKANDGAAQEELGQVSIQFGRESR